MIRGTIELTPIQTLIKSGKRHLAKSFNFPYRDIDGVFSLNNHKFSDYVYGIYPVELEIKETIDDQYHSSFLDLLLEIVHFYNGKYKNSAEDIHFTMGSI